MPKYPTRPVDGEIPRRIRNADYAVIARDTGAFIRSQVDGAQKDGVVLGLSGGIDSAVLAALVRDCLPDGALLMMLPDSRVSPDVDAIHARKLAESLGLEHKTIDIAPIVDGFAGVLEPDRTAMGNLRARIRAGILYYYAGMRNCLVLGSSDRSEFLTGYFTKYGDGAADIMPMTSMYKTQVRGLAEYLRIPRDIIEKRSSPGLWPGHDAEEEIGMPYEEVDSILYCMEEGLSADDTRKRLGIPAGRAERIFAMNKNSMHKRLQAPRTGA